MKIHMRDFAKNKTVFSTALERQRELLLLELSKSVEVNGWFNKVIHALTKKPFLIWN